MVSRHGESSPTHTQNPGQPTTKDPHSPTVSTVKHDAHSAAPIPEKVPLVTDSTILTPNQQRWHAKHTPTTSETAGTRTTVNLSSTAELDPSQRVSESTRVVATEETSEVSPARAQEVPNLFNLIRLTPVQVGLKPIPVCLKPIPIHKGTPPTHDNHSPADNHSPLQPSSSSLFTNMPYTHLPEVSKSLSSSSSHYQPTHQRKTISSQYHSSLKSDHAT